MTPTTSRHLARTIQQDRAAGAARNRFAASAAGTAEPAHDALPAWRLVTTIVGLRRIVVF